MLGWYDPDSNEKFHFWTSPLVVIGVAVALAAVATWGAQFFDATMLWVIKLAW